ncbi:protein of unknown function UPF0182 [Ruminiclostridium papyrosolvens DSM 2782]|uniref:Uncharacterized protein n=1 Tax=Ruminiclostridium papyrosolvens DSM 2782 TaxID=588581 RepID=F1TI66_9FIRM|nr:UPF0182 family protein [Ruminiclostridium papyrosolvens]EGD45844.1 protein of unknown function UPF0182 [Ruminiclostridium papyrosolvens DSM 2782]WES36327.1 UPF0182 family protein [Ruminiclostridium papyrosolvens DSM 2782]
MEEVYDYYKEKEKMQKSHKGGKGKITALIVFALIVVAAIIGSSIYMELIQLKELNPNADYTTVFTKNILYKTVFFIISFVCITLFVFITNKMIRRNLKKYFTSNNLEQRKLINAPVALVIGILGAFLTKEFFFNKALLFLNSANFGIKDPQFGQDIGYYMFQRPFYMSLFSFISNLWLFLVFYTAAYYLIVLMSALNGTLSGKDLKDKTILRHNLINVAIFFILKTVSFKFQRESLLFTNFTSKDITGTGYVDTNIWIKYYTIAPVILLVIVLLAGFFMWKGKLKKSAFVIATFPVLFILLTFASTIIQKAIVGPNEIEFEDKYLKNNMTETRAAFGLDKIQPYDFSKIDELTPEIINNNRNTVDNIRVVDYTPTLNSNKQLQSNTNFYTFHNGDILNYTVNGKEIPVLISAREINSNYLSNQNFVNKTFKYTHGYGVVANPINKLTAQGQVDFLISGLKMDTVDKVNLKVTQPRIYYGQLTNNYVIVNPKSAGKLSEIDYDGTAVSYFDEQGDKYNKIKMNFLNRVLFALKYADTNLLVSSNISSDSKILLNRNVVERAQKGIPFLKVDTDPALNITADGKLVWVLDAYSVSDNYPYSQYYYAQSDDSDLQGLNGINYIRNSVKVTVDAYDGTVKYYVIDKEDPIIKAYQSVYPGLFAKEAFPADLASHVRYPETLFKLQTEVLKKYHLDPKKEENISTFYTGQDEWSIAKYPDTKNEGGARDIDAYYNMVKLPGDIGKNEELILMRPFTPSGEKHNMVSWLAVRNDIENYGKMILFNFPKNTNILGPDQFEVNINQISEISEDMTLWGQGGSRVFKGSLLVIPIENSILYVEPIYIQANSASSIPQVKRVVVGYQQGADFKHGIGDNLESALNNLFGGNGKPADGKPTTNNQGQQGNTTAPSTDASQSVDKQKLDELQQKLDQLMKQSQEINDLLKTLRK